MTALDAVKARIAPLREKLSVYPRLWEVFEHCFINTLETTVEAIAPGDTFIITGDIHAMWQRDSSAQVMHYLRFADDPAVASMIEGLIARQTENTLRDPYANSFNREETKFKLNYDEPLPNDWVWEQKYEVDSLCNPILLAWRYYEKTGSVAFLTERFHEALKTAAHVFRVEQHHENSPYRFTRENCPYHDTLHHEGKGEPVGYTGMTWSGFRPSDDACTYGYLIPSELFAAKEMRHAAKFAELLGDTALKAECESLAAEITAGIERYGTVQHPKYGQIYAYETDGLGNYVIMDDANVPSLLSLPYLGLCEKDDPLYLRTRAYSLSTDNPYYRIGSAARGVGSPHTPEGYIWHIGLCVQAMTTDDTDEIAGILNMIMSTDAGTGCMHESFDPNDPEKFTRAWFAWANSMFGQMIYDLFERGLLDEVLDKALSR